MSKAFSELLEKEQKNIERVKAQYPDFFTREAQIDDEATLKKTGIFGLAKNRPIGYIKLWPQDFIVEEIDKDNILHSVFVEEKDARGDGEGMTVYADLVKVGLSTIDVRAELVRALGVEEKFIGAAGIKDRDALTSQLISFRNVERQKIENLSFPNFFLKNIRQGKGVVDKGMLSGNRFTITMRLMEGSDASSIPALIEEVSRKGFWNFYYLQRFGTPRLITHIWGLYILRGEYEQAVKTMIAQAGEREVPFFKELRRQAGERWGDWKAIEEIFDLFPLSFRSELAMLEFLKDHPKDFKGALGTIPQQVQLGMYAYSSFLFNSLLSSYILDGREPPAALPLFLSKSKEHQNLYQKFFVKHNVRMPSPAFYDFPFVQWTGHLIPTKVKAQVYSYKILPGNILVVDFALPKGSYATSFLASLCTLAYGKPVIAGISLGEIDAFEHAGRGNLQETLGRFKDVIVAKVEDESANGNSEE